MDLTQRATLAELCDAVLGPTPAGLRASLFIAAEESCFIRFNHAKVRQAQHIGQAWATLTLSDTLRAAQATASLSGDVARDAQALGRLMLRLAQELPGLPEDPHLVLPDEVVDTERESRGAVPDAATVIDAVATQAEGLDFVGLYAGGPVVRMYADSRGQRNWHRVETFSLDWSLYHRTDKAVKSLYAGTHWEPAAFRRGMDEGRTQLASLQQPAMALAPGRYRAYFSPAAMAELLGTLSWGGFGHKEQAVGTSPLMRLVRGEARLDSRIHLREDLRRGAAPAFTPDGFTRPEELPLVTDGAHASSLCSPRSAREYGLVSNGAPADEGPQSLHLLAGDLPEAEALEALGTGLYISNLHYLNYSDRRHCRITGMTRFACFWVEHGRRVAPLEVMRFDDDLLAMLGPRLLALGDRAIVHQDTHTYGERMLGSITTPGALIDGFNLTL